MHLQELKKLETRLLEPISIPVIGRCLQEKAVAALAEDDSPDAVEVLAKAVISLKDEEIKGIILDALCKIKNQQCIDVFCQVWADTRHQDLTNLLVKKSWVASRPVNIRVLSALKAKQLVITDGGQEIVEPLLNAFQDRDSEIANRASECATMFDQPKYQELLCRLVSEQDHPIARQVAIKAQYAPRKPSQRALFYFLTDQWDKYENLDFEQSLLQTAFEHSNEQLRQKITKQIRKAGRVELLKVFAGGNQNRRLGEMTDAEWETILNVLNSGEQWEEMWQLAQKATAIWSNSLFQKFGQVAWLPKLERDQAGFEKLKQLSDKCLGKPQSMSKLTSCQATLSHCPPYRTYRITFSPDGKILASAAGGIKLWQMPNGQLQLTISDKILPGGAGITFSPDGKILAGHNSKETIYLWQMPDGKLLATLTYDNGIKIRLGNSNDYKSWYIDKIIFSPDGKIIASSCLDNQIRLWRIADGKFLATLSGHTARVQGITFSPDSKILASCSKNKIIKLWRMPDGKLLDTLSFQTPEPNEEIKQTTFNPDGKILASCSTWGTIKLWRIPDCQLLATLSGHTGGMSEITFSPDGKILASCGDESCGFDKPMNQLHNIKLWRMPDCQLLATLFGHTRGMRGITFSPDGKILASYSHDATIRLWQMSDRKLLANLTDHKSYITNVVFSPDGKLLASIADASSFEDGDDGKIRIWSSDLSWLIHKPIGKLNQQDREFIETALQDNEISQQEKHWLEFMQALMDWHGQFDVEVEDAPQLVSTGEFDIEIEG